MKILSLTLLLLAGCQPVPSSGPGICRGPEGVRPCSPKEQAMIDGMRYIISQIRTFDPNYLNISFKGGGSDLEKSRVLIFGEKHTEIISQIEVLGAMNALAEPGDMILLEGSDRKNKYFEKCALWLIYHLYVNIQWERRGANYTVDALKSKEEWMKQEDFLGMLKSTRPSYDVSDLNLSKLTCGFWDDGSALADTYKHNITEMNFKKRNESMVLAMDEGLKHAARIFIVTGYLHMPIGDFLYSRALNQNNPKFPQDLAEYYRILRKNGKKRASFVLENTAGTTEPIYNYLIDNNIPHRQLLHGKLFYP